MNEKIANSVHPVIDYGLSLRAFLDSGNAINFEQEQAKLLDLLLAESNPSKQLEQVDHNASEVFNDRRRMTKNFLGIRYALVCWLDEIFTDNQSTKQLWNEHKLEANLYGTNDRAWKFWEQAELAQSFEDTSALEVFYLCVNLGFRGELRDQPEKLRGWANRTKLRLGKVKELDFPYFTEQSFRNVPLLNGQSRFRRMAISCWASLVVIVPLIAYALIQKFGQ